MERIKIFTFAVIIAFLLIIARLFYWQVIRGSELASMGNNQYFAASVIQGKRGEILASDGSPLVSRRTGWNIYYVKDKQTKKNTEDLKKVLSIIYPGNDEKVVQELERVDSVINNSKGNWIPILNRVDDAKKGEIEALDFNWLEFESHELSYYPEASTAAHMLGFVGKNDTGEDVGYFGLEGYYNLVLSGKPYRKVTEKDRSLDLFLRLNKSERNKYTGVELHTTIIKPLQRKVEVKLAEGITKYNAKSATAIVMEPNTGEILAMAALPNYDPRNYSEYSNDVFLNPIVSSGFEPGSVFKIVVMASAIDAKVIDQQSLCQICTGPVNIDGYSIETWNDKYYPESSMTDIIVHSDNVGMVYVSQKLGKDRMIDYLKKFGLGSLTGIDLQGEMTPVLRKDKDWRNIDLATASFGQGIAVTPIQLITAAATIANRGYKVQPHIVAKLVKDNWEEALFKDKKESVISADAANYVVSMMAEAAKNGEAKWTHLKGFRVAGKTGTAQIPIQGHYDEDKTVASFIGFAPFDKPKFIMLVTLFEPQSSQWASETAAPLWYSIAKDLFLYFGISPEVD